jgi:hypothetical protein
VPISSVWVRDPNISSGPPAQASTPDVRSLLISSAE